MTDLINAAAYGGPGWSPRTASLRDEIGVLWASCGIDSEWAPLKAVLLHRPGPELAAADPDAAQQLDAIDAALAAAQHDTLAAAYRAEGVTVHYVSPPGTPPPNLIFVADLLFMTPEGAIVGRPASTVRAGEERWIARRLADLGIPILRTVRGHGVFEGADAAWLDARTVLLATGLRTNTEGAAQVAATLAEMGVSVVYAGLPFGAMHLMGTLRFAGPDLAIAWHGRVPYAAVEALRARGFRLLFMPDEEETSRRNTLNFVTLGPRRILMPAGSPATRAFFEAAGIACREVEIDELAKAAGGIGCMTGVLHRRPAH
ncbi:MAG: amidinotransferase [Anaerolineae bacterium]|nr:amidinotransferase [Anaerolineae bacterium]